MACRCENVGGMKRMMLALLVAALAWMSLAFPALHAAEAPLRAGMAIADVTPAGPYPMSGYYFERLSTGTKDPLHAKALVLRQGDTAAAIICCDLIVIASDLTLKNHPQEMAGF